VAVAVAVAVVAAAVVAAAAAVAAVAAADGDQRFWHGATCAGEGTISRTSRLGH
jgi:hypothetical protein